MVNVFQIQAIRLVSVTQRAATVLPASTNNVSRMKAMKTVHARQWAVRLLLFQGARVVTKALTVVPLKRAIARKNANLRILIVRWGVEVHRY